MHFDAIELRDNQIPTIYARPQYGYPYGIRVDLRRFLP